MRVGYARRVVARFHGGHLDGQVITEWLDPPASSVWAERVRGGQILTDPPESEPDQPADQPPSRFDRYTRFETIADLAVYHLAESG
jgi:hypothetical protein